VQTDRLVIGGGTPRRIGCAPGGRSRSGDRRLGPVASPACCPCGLPCHLSGVVRHSIRRCMPLSTGLSCRRTGGGRARAHSCL